MHTESYIIKNDSTISDLNMYFLQQERSANSQYEVTILKMYNGRTVKGSKVILSEMQEDNSKRNQKLLAIFIEN
jgi:hypothetical protein